MDFQRLDRIRIAAALVAAVLTAGAALFGVYQKSRKETQASYETLAPQINALSDAVERLRVDVERASRERAAAPPPSAAASLEPSPPAVPAPSTIRRPRPERPATARTRREPTRPPAPAGQPSGSDAPGSEPASPNAPTGSSGPTGAPGSEPTPAESPPTSPPAVPPPEQPEVVEKIQKRVPIDFDKALEVWRDIQDLKKQAPK